ncbi:hypothetical protein H8E77_31785 [bacterium]|nr:hypothetical protein [bacterium]
MLYHVSDEPNIKLFKPRPSQFTDNPAVWAIDSEHLRNYLLPRDCPRVTFYALSTTTQEDRQRFLGTSKAVVAVEGKWLPRILACKLYCYHFSPEDFECLDEGAGYFVNYKMVVPKRMEVFKHLLEELVSRQVEVRIMPNLWHLREAVVNSTLQYSNIRMRNASPQE